tara:strand:- start:10 stop:849 length:840 start_codon:yes stop_codon:yes gene_type:complete
MKRILLVLLVSLGLQTQAQINYCDSLNLDMVISQTNPPISGFAVLNPSLNPSYYSSITNWYWSIMTLPVTPTSCPDVYFVQNPVVMVNELDTIEVCLFPDLSINNTTLSCIYCNTYVFDGMNWLPLTQPPITYCDSLSYTTSSTMNYPFIAMGDAGSISNMVDSISWSWSVCNSSMCYSGYGDTASFGQVITTDTLKVCYDAYIYLNGATYICTGCDSLVYDNNSYSWVLLNTSSPTAIQELTLETINDNKIYDMLGRELNEVPLGTMYIQNGKKYIRR